MEISWTPNEDKFARRLDPIKQSYQEETFRVMKGHTEFMDRLTETVAKYSDQMIGPAKASQLGSYFKTALDNPERYLGEGASKSDVMNKKSRAIAGVFAEKMSELGGHAYTAYTMRNHKGEDAIKLADKHVIEFMDQVINPKEEAVAARFNTIAHRFYNISAGQIFTNVSDIEAKDQHGGALFVNPTYTSGVFSDDEVGMAQHVIGQGLSSSLFAGLFTGVSKDYAGWSSLGRDAQYIDNDAKARRGWAMFLSMAVPVAETIGLMALGGKYAKAPGATGAIKHLPKYSPATIAAIRGAATSIADQRTGAHRVYLDLFGDGPEFQETRPGDLIRSMVFDATTYGISFAATGLVVDPLFKAGRIGLISTPYKGMIGKIVAAQGKDKMGEIARTLATAPLKTFIADVGVDAGIDFLAHAITTPLGLQYTEGQMHALDLSGLTFTEGAQKFGKNMARRAAGRIGSGVMRRAIANGNKTQSEAHNLMAFGGRKWMQARRDNHDLSASYHRLWRFGNMVYRMDFENMDVSRMRRIGAVTIEDMLASDLTPSQKRSILGTETLLAEAQNNWTVAAFFGLRKWKPLQRMGWVDPGAVEYERTASSDIGLSDVMAERIDSRRDVITSSEVQRIANETLTTLKTLKDADASAWNKMRGVLKAMSEDKRWSPKRFKDFITILNTASADYDVQDKVRQYLTSEDATPGDRVVQDITQADAAMARRLMDNAKTAETVSFAGEDYAITDERSFNVMVQRMKTVLSRERQPTIYDKYSSQYANETEIIREIKTHFNKVVADYDNNKIDSSLRGQYKQEMSDVMSKSAKSMIKKRADHIFTTYKRAREAAKHDTTAQELGVQHKNTIAQAMGDMMYLNSIFGSRILEDVQSFNRKVNETSNRDIKVFIEAGLNESDARTKYIDGVLSGKKIEPGDTKSYLNAIITEMSVTGMQLDRSKVDFHNAVSTSNKVGKGIGLTEISRFLTDDKNMAAPAKELLKKSPYSLGAIDQVFRVQDNNRSIDDLDASRITAAENMLATIFWDGELGDNVFRKYGQSLGSRDEGVVAEVVADGIRATLIKAAAMAEDGSEQYRQFYKEYADFLINRGIITSSGLDLVTTDEHVTMKNLTVNHDKLRGIVSQQVSHKDYRVEVNALKDLMIEAYTSSRKDLSIAPEDTDHKFGITLESGDRIEKISNIVDKLKKNAMDNGLDFDGTLMSLARMSSSFEEFKAFAEKMIMYSNYETYKAYDKNDIDRIVGGLAVTYGNRYANEVSLDPKTFQVIHSQNLIGNGGSLRYIDGVTIINVNEDEGRAYFREMSDAELYHNHQLIRTYYTGAGQMVEYIRIHGTTSSEKISNLKRYLTHTIEASTKQQGNILTEDDSAIKQKLADKINNLEFKQGKDIAKVLRDFFTEGEDSVAGMLLKEYKEARKGLELKKSAVIEYGDDERATMTAEQIRTIRNLANFDQIKIANLYTVLGEIFQGGDPDIRAARQARVDDFIKAQKIYNAELRNKNTNLDRVNQALQEMRKQDILTVREDITQDELDGALSVYKGNLANIGQSYVEFLERVQRLIASDPTADMEAYAKRTTTVFEAALLGKLSGELQPGSDPIDALVTDFANSMNKFRSDLQAKTRAMSADAMDLYKQDRVLGPLMEMVVGGAERKGIESPINDLIAIIDKKIGIFESLNKDEATKKNLFSDEYNALRSAYMYAISDELGLNLEGYGKRGASIKASNNTGFIDKNKTLISNFKDRHGIDKMHFVIVPEIKDVYGKAVGDGMTPMTDMELNLLGNLALSGWQYKAMTATGGMLIKNMGTGSDSNSEYGRMITDLVSQGVLPADATLNNTKIINSGMIKSLDNFTFKHITENGVDVKDNVFGTIRAYSGADNEDGTRGWGDRLAMHLIENTVPHEVSVDVSGRHNSGHQAGITAKVSAYNQNYGILESTRALQGDLSTALATNPLMAPQEKIQLLINAIGIEPKKTADYTYFAPLQKDYNERLIKDARSRKVEIERRLTSLRQRQTTDKIRTEIQAKEAYLRQLNDTITNATAQTETKNIADLARELTTPGVTKQRYTEIMTELNGIKRVISGGIRPGRHAFSDLGWRDVWTLSDMRRAINELTDDNKRDRYNNLLVLEALTNETATAQELRTMFYDINNEIKDLERRASYDFTGNQTAYMQYRLGQGDNTRDFTAGAKIGDWKLLGLTIQRYNLLFDKADSVTTVHRGEEQTINREFVTSLIRRMNTALEDRSHISSNDIDAAMKFLSAQDSNNTLMGQYLIRTSVAGENRYLMSMGRSPYDREGADTWGIVLGIQRNLDGVAVSYYDQIVKSADFDGDKGTIFTVEDVSHIREAYRYAYGRERYNSLLKQINNNGLAGYDATDVALLHIINRYNTEAFNNAMNKPIITMPPGENMNRVNRDPQRDVGMVVGAVSKAINFYKSALAMRQGGGVFDREEANKAFGLGKLQMGKDITESPDYLKEIAVKQRNDLTKDSMVLMDSPESGTAMGKAYGVIEDLAWVDRKVTIAGEQYHLAITRQKSIVSKPGTQPTMNTNIYAVQADGELGTYRIKGWGQLRDDDDTQTRAMQSSSFVNKASTATDIHDFMASISDTPNNSYINKVSRIVAGKKLDMTNMEAFNLYIQKAGQDAQSKNALYSWVNRKGGDATAYIDDMIATIAAARHFNAEMGIDGERVSIWNDAYEDLFKGDSRLNPNVEVALRNQVLTKMQSGNAKQLIKYYTDTMKNNSDNRFMTPQGYTDFLKINNNGRVSFEDIANGLIIFDKNRTEYENLKIRHLTDAAYAEKMAVHSPEYISAMTKMAVYETIRNDVFNESLLKDMGVPEDQYSDFIREVGGKNILVTKEGDAVPRIVGLYNTYNAIKATSSAAGVLAGTTNLKNIFKVYRFMTDEGYQSEAVNDIRDYETRMVRQIKLANGERSTPVNLITIRQTMEDMKLFAVHDNTQYDATARMFAAEQYMLRDQIGVMDMNRLAADLDKLIANERLLENYPSPRAGVVRFQEQRGGTDYLSNFDVVKRIESYMSEQEAKITDPKLGVTARAKLEAAKVVLDGLYGTSSPVARTVMSLRGSGMSPTIATSIKTDETNTRVVIDSDVIDAINKEGFYGTKYFEKMKMELINPPTRVVSEVC